MTHPLLRQVRSIGQQARLWMVGSGVCVDRGDDRNICIAGWSVGLRVRRPGHRRSPAGNGYRFSERQPGCLAFHERGLSGKV